MEGDSIQTAAVEAPPAEAPAAAPPESSSPPAAQTTPPDARDAFADGFKALPRDGRGRFTRAEPETAAEPVEADPPAAADVTPAPAPVAEPPTASAEPAAPPEIPADVLEQAVAREMARREQEAADKKAADEQAEAARTAAQQRQEALFGKPGELAGLLRKQAAWNQGQSDDPFTQEDQTRLDTLVLKATDYETFKARALEDHASEIEQVRAEAEERVTNARGMTQKMLDGWAAQIQAVAGLGIEGIDQAYIASKDAEQLTAIVSKAHAAGAASRDGEVEDLKAQLAEARASAFGSQPQLVTAGGASPSGRGRPGLAADASPRDAFAEGFAQQGVGTTHGRR